MNLAQILAENRVRILTKEDKHKILKISKEIDLMELSDLNDIKWVWEATIKILLENWISSQEDLLKVNIDDIKKLKLNYLSEIALIKFIK